MYMLWEFFAKAGTTVPDSVLLGAGLWALDEILSPRVIDLDSIGNAAQSQPYQTAASPTLGNSAIHITKSPGTVQKHNPDPIAPPCDHLLLLFLILFLSLSSSKHRQSCYGIDVNSRQCPRCLARLASEAVQKNFAYYTLSPLN